jgi:uncharacterized protein YigA (DUF484 family)
MNKASTIDEQLEMQIGEYLQQHPDYLLRHPGVLAQLEIHHDSGAAVSLIEHKIKILQQQSGTYRQQLEDLIDVARENEDLHHHLHRLTLTLLKARRQADVQEILQEELTSRFRADAVVLKLFSAAQLEALPGDATPAMFEEFMQADRPSCGELSAEKLRSLFDEQLGDSGSAALIPIRTSNLSGVLAIGSKDSERFPPDKGVDFLIGLGELVSLTLQAVSAKE